MLLSFSNSVLHIKIRFCFHIGLIFTSVCKETETNSENAEHDELTDLTFDGLENLAGYICYKLGDEVPNISTPKAQPQTSYTWVNHLSEGGLSKPTNKMMDHMQTLHTIFQKLNQDGLLITNGFLKKHLEEASHIQCSDKIKKLFFRARMFFLIRKLNKEIIETANSRKRKFNKILN